MSKNQLLREAFFDVSGDDENVDWEVEGDGNFTVVLLYAHKDRTIGVSKCNPECDTFDEERGEEIALFRAIKKLMEQSPKNPLSKKLLKAVG